MIERGGFCRRLSLAYGFHICFCKIFQAQNLEDFNFQDTGLNYPAGGYSFVSSGDLSSRSFAPRSTTTLAGASEKAANWVWVSW